MLRLMPALCSLLALTVAWAETPVDCDSKTTGGDYFEIRCPLRSSEAAEWRLRVDFAGVHDDSAAKMAVSIDGAAVECAPESKPQLLGVAEEGGAYGDDFVECRLTADADAKAERQLLVVLTWKHAQHVSHELVAVPRRD